MSKIKKGIRQAFVLIFAAMLAFVPCGCDKGRTEEKFSVWTAYGTEKILQSFDYSSRTEEKTLTINAFQNEYESAQIIISAETDVKSYVVEKSDLKHTDGKSVISSDCFTLYNQKYINVTKIYNKNGNWQLGMYPDALLPFDVAVQYGENVVKAGENQGIWVQLKVPKGQKAGSYNGNFTLRAGGKTVGIPVNVTVYDFEICDESHSKGSYAVYREHLGWGEQNSTVEMVEKYVDYLLDYRAQPQHLPGNELENVYDLEAFLEQAEKYSKDVRCSSYTIPYNAGVSTVDGVDFASMNFDDFETILIAMMKRSVERQVDLFEKAGTYFIYFDEAVINGLVYQANYTFEKVNRIQNELYEKFKKAFDENSSEYVCKAENVSEEEQKAFKEKVLESFRKVKHKFVDEYTDELTQPAQYVPLISQYDTPSSRAQYESADKRFYGDDGELWTYTCLQPNSPYPTFHTDDYLLTSRLLGWMMYNYNIVGSLYWNTALYARRDLTVDEFEDLPIWEYYSGAANRYPSANGDGYLLYPGRPYGIDGPVGTIRLQSFRDGMEDYELLYALEKAYGENGRDVIEEKFDNVVQLLYGELYAGTQVNTEGDVNARFSSVRKSLSQLLTIEKNASVVIENVEKTDGKYVFEISADADCKLKESGIDLSPSGSYGNRNIYRVEKTLDNESNYLNLSASVDGKQESLSLYLGGKIVSFGAETLAKATTLDGKTSTISVETTEFGADYAVLKAEMSDLGADSVHNLSIDTVALNAGEMTKITVKIYNGGEDTEVRFFADMKNGASISLTSVLKNGWNEIELIVDGKYAEMVKALRFRFDGRARTVAIGEVTIQK